MSKGTFDMTHEELGKITRSMRSSTFREELGSYVDERSDPKHRDEEDIFWEESARNGSIPAGNIVIKPQPGFVARTKLRLTNGAYMNFYMNICFSPVLKDVEMEAVNGGQSIKMPQVFSEARIEREDGETGSTCQTCVSVVSMKTLMMGEVMPELKEIIVDQTIAVMKKNFVSEGENLSPDYEILSNLKCKGVRPRFCLAPFDYLVPNYKKFSAKDVAFQGQAGGNSDVITPGQIESLKRRHEQDEATKKAATSTSDKVEVPENATQEDISTSKAKKQTNIVVGKSYNFVEASAAAVDGEKGCEVVVVETNKVSTAATMEGDKDAVSMQKNLPSHLTVRVKLPGVTSAAGIDVDVEEGQLLKLRVAGKFCVEKKLPYAVDFASAGAKFVKQSSELEMTLPVVSV